MPDTPRVREPTELDAIRTLEMAIGHLAVDFQGAKAFDYWHEPELASSLLSAVRGSNACQEHVNGTRLHLARLEWPFSGVKLRRIDLVIWRPGTVLETREYWRDKTGLSEIQPLLAAVQIKRGGGKPTPATGIGKDIRDLEKIHANDLLEQPILYYLEWIDHDLRDGHENDTVAYRHNRSLLKSWCDEGPDRRALVISRDHVGFAYPEGGWLVDPLPHGTIKEVQP